MAEDAKNQRRASKGRFTRKLNELKKSIDENCGQEIVKRNYDELVEAWKKVESKYDFYTTFLTDEEVEAEEVWILELQDLFIDATKRQIQYEKDKTTTDKEVKDHQEQTQAVLREQEKVRRMIEQAFVRRSSAEAVFEQALDNVSKSSPKVLKTAKKELDTAFADCKKANNDYISLLSKEKATAEIAWIIAMQKLYTQANDEAETRLSEELSAQETAKMNNLRLEKIKLPRFEGELREYPRFKTDFQKQVMPSLSTETAPYTLRSCLGKEPMGVVKSVDDDIDQIWKRLDEKYGDPSKIVDAIIDTIRKVRPMKDGENKRLIEFIDVVEDGYRDLKRLGLEVEMTTTSSVSIIEKKLPTNVRKEWAKMVTDDDSKVEKVDKFPSLLRFLLSQKRAFEYDSAELRTTHTSYKSAVHHVAAKEQDTCKSGEKQHRYSDGKTTQKCLVHDNANHWTDECRTYLSKPYSEKKELVKTKKACWSCLKPGHIFRDCKRKRNCGENGCTKRHHKTLHDPEENQNCPEESMNNQEKKTQEEKNLDGKRASSCDSLADTCLLLFQEIPTPKGDVNVMWDSGASVCFITNSKAKEQRLPSKDAQLTIVKVGGEAETVNSKKYKLHLIDRQRQVVEIEAFGIDKITSDIQRIDVEGVVHLFKDVTKEEIARPEGSVDVLIGYEYAAFHPEPEQKVEHLILLNNRFGRCLGGNHPLIKDVKETRSQHVVGTAYHVGQVKPKVDLEDFYKIENLGIECTPRCGSCKCGKCPPGTKDYTLKEERELKLIERNLKFNNEENRWITDYPWIRNPADLPDNIKLAMGLLISTEKRLAKNAEHAKVYQEQIDDMITRDVARKLTADEIKNYDGPVHYISHHEVMRPDSKSTPVRIVFNSSANYMGHILNEYWAKGPDLLNNLLGVLIRFRENETAFTGDIKKMYHTVKISIKDQHTHRFLWRNMDGEREPDTYVIQRVSFGDKPAGTIATVALRKTAEMALIEYPQAAKTIINNTYMDDIIDSAENKETAKSLTTDIEKVLKGGGFQIKYWTFSFEPNQNDDAQVLPKEKSSSTEKVLGVVWGPVEDQFYFKVRLNFSPKKKKLRTEPDLSVEQIPEKVPEPLTKRMILSQVNGIYDPMGLAGPFTVRAKMLMRRLWLNNPKLDWDDPIPDKFKSEWLQIFKLLFDMERISFNRCLKPSDAIGDPSLVVFSDGSHEAYGACAYVRWEMPENTFESNLIMSKNRLTPVKKMSIDRIELCGAVLNKRLKAFIEKESRYNFVEFYHLVDSQIVQAMIQKESYGFNTFAGTRIGEIQEKTKPSDWYWIDGELNIADWLTRGKKPDDLDVDTIWQKGPAFLKLPVSEWPVTKKPTSMVLPETVQPVMIADSVQSDTLVTRINIERFSSYIRLLRVTARVLAMYHKDASPRNKLSFKNAAKVLSSEEIERAELFWIKDAQIKLKQKVNDKSLKRLCPSANQDGVIIVGGRVDKWIQMSYNQNEVILLPYNHRFSRLYMTHLHNQGHYGIATTVAKVRTRFWIIGAHKMAKSIKFHCVTCKKLEKKVEDQAMSQLPVERLKPAPAWSSTGIDLFGPFSIRDEVKKRSTGKAYGVIFNCLGTRAVHVDISPDYSAQKFLMVLRRFVALRGYPKQIISDNGTQLVAANEELKSMTESWDWNTLVEYGATKGMHWKFTPADAPWYNGVSEALIKSVKKALTVAIGNNVMTFSELQTVCYEAANLVNERPIGRIPTHPEDGKYLCPNDLLLGRSTPRIPSGPFKETANPRYRFQFVQSVVNAFWKKWTQNFFPSLLIRQKWHTARRNVKVGDVVLMQDPNLVRGNWKLAKVCKADPDQDGRVRRVQVQYKVPKQGESLKSYKGRGYTTVERAVQRLVVLIQVEETEINKNIY